MAQSTWLNNKIDNLNFLAPNGFKLTIENFPKVSFLCQSSNIPGLRIPTIDIATPFRDYPIAGTECEFEDLTVEFLIDENLENYVTIHKWLRKTGLAETFDNDPTPIESVGVLEILSSNWRTNNVIEFFDLFPVSLSTLNFNSADTNVEYMVASATFKYRIYRIKNKNGDVIS